MILQWRNESLLEVILRIFLDNNNLFFIIHNYVKIRIVVIVTNKSIIRNLSKDIYSLLKIY